uniref:Uncharacterized protein n=1 Tax=Anguilla anguilla TaxID=7936 RepID=A0A0E9U9R8_ANGAN
MQQNNKRRYVFRCIFKSISLKKFRLYCYITLVKTF